MRGRDWFRSFAALILPAALAASCGDAAFELLPPGPPDAGAQGGSSGGFGGISPGDAAPDVGSAEGDAGQAGAPWSDQDGFDCPGGDCYAQSCPPFGMSCVRCDDDGDCPLAAPYCEATLRRCVECFAPADCGPGTTCDPLSGSCAPSCSGPGECPSTLPLCDPARAICVECIEDTHCRTDASSPFCVIGTCVECYAREHCPNERPFCHAFSCDQCLYDYQCAADQHCLDGSCEVRSP